MMHRALLRAEAMDLVKPPHAPGISTVAQMPNVTPGLLRRGYTETDVRRGLGLNWLELFERIWDGGEWVRA